MKATFLVIPLTLILFVAYSGSFVVNETEQVVITQFGRPVGQATTNAGLHFKIPLIQQAHFFPKTLLEWDGDPGQIPTLDKTFLYADTFARWRIVDPLVFFQTVNNLTGALARLDDILDAAVRNLISSHPLIETVRWTNRQMDTFEVGLDVMGEERFLGEVTMGRQQITRAILEQAQPKLSGFGIEIIDVQIKRLNYVPEVQQSVFARMIAERKQIAEKFRSEGQGEARKIEGDTEKEMKKITSEAYKTAQEISGKADAEAALIYAQSYGVDPDFYSFLRTLELYKASIGGETTLVLGTDSEIYSLLKEGVERRKGTPPPQNAPRTP